MYLVQSADFADSLHIGIVLCSGLLPSIIGVAHVAIQFPLYEAMKTYLAGSSPGQEVHLGPLQLVRVSSHITPKWRLVTNARLSGK